MAIERPTVSGARPGLPPRAAKPSGGALRTWVRAYLVLVVLVAIMVQWLADRWWPATLIVFAPRWPWALPLLLLVPLALFRAPRQLGSLAVAALVLLFGIGGFVPPSPAAWMQRDAPAQLRVASYNLGGVADAARLAPWLARTAPDVAVFQECAVLLERARAPLQQAGWHVQTQHGSCIASRHPIRRTDARDPNAIWKMAGSGVMVRYVIEMPGGQPVNVVNLHLETVREGLQAIRHRGWGGIAELESNIEQRDIESMLASAFALQSEGPLLVAGDLNMPVESAIYRRHWGGVFTNAFGCAGIGFGHTKATRWHGVRIDHVLLGPGWECVRSEVGEELGGDHRAVMSDLRWGGPGPS